MRASLERQECQGPVSQRAVDAKERDGDVSRGRLDPAEKCEQGGGTKNTGYHGRRPPYANILEQNQHKYHLENKGDGLGTKKQEALCHRTNYTAWRTHEEIWLYTVQNIEEYLGRTFDFDW